MLNKTRWPYPRIIAHRGGGVMAPENTLVAIRVAASMGFGGVEFDVKLAACGTPVLIHDDTVDRTTDHSGAVVTFDAQELKHMDAGSWFANEFATEGVPSFEAAAALCRHLGLWANVEIKPDADNEAETGSVVAQSTARFFGDASPAPLLSSFSEAALRAAMEAAPQLPRALLVETVPPNWQQKLETLKCVALHCDHEALNQDLIAELHNAGYGVLGYTVNETGRAITLFETQIDAIVTDELREIRPDFLSIYGL